MMRSAIFAVFSALVASACQSSRPASPRGEATVANRAAPSVEAAPPSTRPAPPTPRYSVAPAADPDFPSSAAQLLPVAVRIGAHDDFERVVFELEGAGEPGWRVEYVDAAIADPSGERVEVAGAHSLQVTLTGVRYPDDGDTGRLARGSYPGAGTELVAEVHVEGIFEGQSQAFIGVHQRAPFRVFTQTNPIRVVIDLQR